ncbi:hypothetical protein CesoFtcFv8_009658 [Champsocephalus esox]|uniref:Uncharacterized protein n=1 Tax=Champsocephalus esox TaxID=159716 RepID=A0AAN8GYX1_9TELE|nr:hypothetical protein CesoFtcFv8_009658 [Champsocephalus esox]
MSGGRAAASEAALTAGRSVFTRNEVWRRKGDSETDRPEALKPRRCFRPRFRFIETSIKSYDCSVKTSHVAMVLTFKANTLHQLTFMFGKDTCPRLGRGLDFRTTTESRKCPSVISNQMCSK